MPRRRPSGGQPHRRRRRRDAQPNLPRETSATSSDENAADRADDARPAPQQPPIGARVRPTLRRGFVATARAATSPALEIDYAYVVRDLRQIGILAVGGMLVLVALTLVIR